MQNKQIHTSVPETDPLVSFIITYYNQPIQMLCACINSIMGLDMKEEKREIVVIDDGSEVSPMNGLMHYGDSIIYVRQPNGGLSKARNKGIEVAQGEYLQFVDADDQLVTKAYDHCLQLLRSHEGIDMVVFDFTDKADERQTTYSEQNVVSGTQYMLRNNIHGTACGFLARRKTVSELRFTPDIWHEDEEFTPQVLIRAEQVVVTNARAYYYYKHGGSITTHSDEASKDKRLSDLRGVIGRLHTLCDRVPPGDRPAMQRRTAQLTMDYIYQTIVQKRSAKALRECIDDLHKEGLFPLPDKDYSTKYQWFRRMTNNAMGRTLLLHTLPLWKER
jgi:glycosyltransferase involved in cell wall biosynthesis